MKYKKFETGVLLALGAVYIITCLVQFSAIFDLLLAKQYTKVTAFVLATCVGYTPIVGTAAGYFAVLKVWGLSLKKALIIFAPVEICTLFVFVVLMVYRNRKRRRG